MRTSRLQSFTWTCLLWTGLAWTAVSFSQNQEPVEDDTIRWWQVEVIIFSQGNNSATSSEVWPTDVELSYPNNWQELLPFNDPNAEESGTTNGAGTEQSVTGSKRSNSETEAETTEKPSYDNSETLFLLPEEEQQLRDTRSKLIRNSNRRILFHQAWRQSMEQNKDEEAILITGGDQFDDHFELEGSIKIYWQRLLHFDTNLWLTEFSINSGQERLDWPELPPRPNIAIPEYGLLDLDRIKQDENKPFNNSSRANNQGTDKQITNNPITNPTFTDNTFQNSRLGGNRSIGQINTVDWLGQRGNTTFYDSRYDEILSRSYLVNNVVVLKQNRSMRSSELHYLDHPQLGILVKITPYEEPELGEEDAGESAAENKLDPAT